MFYTTDTLKTKDIEYRVVKCNKPNMFCRPAGENEKAFYLQTLIKGFFKDYWRDYWESNHPLIRDQKFFATEEGVDEYVKKYCEYNPTRTKFLKHPTIEIV